MALNETEGMGTTMLVQPSGGSGFGNGFGGDGWWILLLFILLGGNGWGNGFGGFGGNAVADMYPWMNQSNQISDGFRDQMLGTQVNGIQSAITSGFGDLQTALCGGFAGVNAGIANGFAQAEIANNGRQMANMNQAFAAQTAMANGFNTLGSQLATCCCENRLATANLQSVIQSENCADRAALSEALRDVLTANNANTQKILDTMCQDKIDAKNEKIVELQNQLNIANLAASQSVQTAQLIADNTAQTQYIVNRVAPYPIPSYTVPNPYGTGTTT